MSNSVQILDQTSDCVGSHLDSNHLQRSLVKLLPSESNCWVQEGVFSLASLENVIYSCCIILQNLLIMMIKLIDLYTLFRIKQDSNTDTLDPNFRSTELKALIQNVCITIIDLQSSLLTFKDFSGDTFYRLSMT